jgi:hypothetical protein
VCKWGKNNLNGVFGALNTPFSRFLPHLTGHPEMRSLTPEFLGSLRYNGSQIATLRALGEFRGKQ